MPCEDPGMPAYTAKVPLRWSDMDAYGHVNNVQMLRLLEDARVIGFADWFGQDRSLLAEGVLVARHEIEYLYPMEFRYRPASVRMWCGEVAGASFQLAYEVTDGEVDDAGRPRVYARAESTMVAYDFASGAPRRLREDERDVLGAYLGERPVLRRR